MKDFFSKFSKPRHHALLFVAGASLLVLGPLLLPGYILLLDWVPSPLPHFSYHDIGSYVQAPSAAFLYGLGLLLPGWVVQKLTLIALIVCLFWFPVRFYPWERVVLAPYLVSLFAVGNPFVYERLLSGQWRVVAGYVGLFPLFYFLYRWGAAPTIRSLLLVFLTLLLIGMWSIHFLVIGCLIVGSYLTYTAITLLHARAYAHLFMVVRQSALGLGLFIICSGYWLVPYLEAERSGLETFDTAHLEAFATARSDFFGVVPNVISMQGFWAEEHGWAEAFRLPGDAPWRTTLAVLAVLAVAGLGYATLRASESERALRHFIAALLMASIVFASGISAYGLWVVNDWLFSHVSFWNGFRDTQKWVGVVVVLYALLFGRGLSYLYARFPTRRSQALITLASVAVVVALAPSLWWGFGRQVAPVWYPSSWHEANVLLTERTDCRAVFLPWQQYYEVAWNDGRLTGNPAGRFFNCNLLTGHNTALGNIADSAPHITDYDQVSQLVKSNSTDPGKIATIIDELALLGITHFIVVPDIALTDIYRYPFLASPRLEVSFTSSELTVYTLSQIRE